MSSFALIIITAMVVVIYWTRDVGSRQGVTDEWLSHYGFPRATPSRPSASAPHTCLFPDLVHPHASETIAQAAHILQE